MPRSRRFSARRAFSSTRFGKTTPRRSRISTSSTRRTTDPERRLRSLALRAQLLIGRGEKERAGDLVAYLRSLEDRVPSRIEETPEGFVLTPTPERTSGWSRYLAQRLEDAGKPRVEPPPRSGFRGLPAESFLPHPPAFGGGFAPAAPEFNQPLPPPDEPEVRNRFGGGFRPRGMRPGPQ